MRNDRCLPMHDRLMVSNRPLQHFIFISDEEPAYAQRCQSRQTVLMGQRG